MGQKTTKPLTPTGDVRYPLFPAETIKLLEQLNIWHMSEPASETLDLSAPKDNFLHPIQTPSAKLLEQLHETDPKDLQKIAIHYRNIADLAQNNSFTLEGEKFLLLPSLKPYFADFETTDGINASHLLIMMQQHSIETLDQIALFFEDLLNSNKENPENKLEELRTKISQDSKTIPNNAPAIDKLILAAEAHQNENMKMVFCQNCAPKSASCKSHLHFQAISEKDPTGKSNFPALNNAEASEIIATVDLDDNKQKLEIKAISAVGTILSIDLTELSTKQKIALGKHINATIEETLNPESKGGFGVDVAVKEAVLFLALRNEKDGGCYQSFGLFNEGKLLHAVGEGADLISIDSKLSALSEPENQTDSAVFIAKLVGKIRRNSLDLPKEEVSDPEGEIANQATEDLSRS